ncbi:hypothetical protein F4781DRAFT_111489 [Annulohypoxylon bovei var. microspora]|nr:hypothetical protein F4781DRAFT_111489 [Annulohypoxylon bovei var. microspora]
MPPSNSKRQSQDARLWKMSPKMYRRSKLQSRGSLGRGDAGSDSLSSRGLRARLVVTRDRAGSFGTRDNDDKVERRDFRTFDQDLVDGISDSSDDSGDELGGFSDDDSGSDDDDMDVAGPPPQQQIQPSPSPYPSLASSSGSIVTLTALQPTQATPQPKAVITALPVLPSPTRPVLAAPTYTDLGDINNYSPTTEKKEEGDMNTMPASTFTTKIQSASTPTTILAAMASTSAIGQIPQQALDNSDNNNDGDKHKMHDKDPPPRGLDPVAEHLLIAAGAIGAFILFCFIGWVIFRVMKKTKGQGIGVSGGFIDQFPWRRRGPMDGTQDGRAMYMANEAPPLYEKGEYGTMQSGTYFGPNKPYPPGPGSAARSVISSSGMGTLRPIPNNDSALASILDQYPAGNEGAANSSDINLTMRTQETQPYYTASELARLQPDNYTPPRRVGNRASELSSISSGFGDGDIIIPPPLAVSKTSSDEAVDNSTTRDTARDSTRESWMDREGGRRETVYTTTSEDRPARFRSIGSWVNQQAGRTKRAGSRARERGEVPVMPAIPGEISAIRQTAYR